MEGGKGDPRICVANLGISSLNDLYTIKSHIAIRPFQTFCLTVDDLDKWNH